MRAGRHDGAGRAGGTTRPANARPEGGPVQADAGQAGTVRRADGRAVSQRAPSGRAPGRPGVRPAVAAPVVPVVATVLLLTVPADRTRLGSPGGATLADLASGILVAWCALALLRERTRARCSGVRAGPALTPRAALVLGGPAVAFAVATVASRDPAASLPGFVRYLQLFVLVPGAVLLSLRHARDARVMCAALVLLALAQGAFGVVQAATGTGASYQGENIRAVGTFGPLDVMAMATVVSYGTVTALAYALSPPAGAPRWLRPCALGTAAALVVPLALSYSRGAWIATGAACLLLLAAHGLRTTLPVLGALAAAAVVLVGGFGVGSQHLAERARSITEVSASPDRSVSDRYSLWSAAAGMWREAPLTGVGPKNFPAHRDAHAPLDLSSGSDTAGAGMAFQREPLLSPHNMYLLVLSEQGLVGAVAFAGSWAALLVCALRRLRGTGHGGPGSSARDCGTVAVGLLVWQAVDFLYGDIGGPSTVLTALVLGLAAWWALSPAADGDPTAGQPPEAQRPGGRRPVAGQPTDGRPTDGRPTDRQPADGRPTMQRPTCRQLTGRQAAGPPPGGSPSAGDRGRPSAGSPAQPCAGEPLDGRTADGGLPAATATATAAGEGSPVL